MLTLDTLPIYAILTVVCAIYVLTTNDDRPKIVFRTSLILPMVTWIIAGTFMLLFFEPLEALYYAVGTLPAASVAIFLMYLILSLRFGYFKKNKNEGFEETPKDDHERVLEE